MLIFVTQEGFVFKPLKTGPYAELCSELYTPYEGCSEFCLKVIRNGKIHDSAKISELGTHGSKTVFCFQGGLQTRYLNKSTAMQPGDEIRIETLPRGVSDVEYWWQMTRRKAQKLTRPLQRKTV